MIMTANEVYWRQLTKLDRKSAIVARGMVQHFDGTDDERSKLRECQKAAIEWAAEVGSPVKGTSLTSKIGRLLRDAGVFMPFEGKPKHGEGYRLEEGPRLAEFIEFLDSHLEYGMLAKGEEDSIKVRVRVLKQLKDEGAVMLDADTHRVDSRTYKALRDMLNEGALKVVYVRPDTLVAVKTPTDAKAHKVDFWVTEDE